MNHQDICNDPDCQLKRFEAQAKRRVEQQAKEAEAGIRISEWSVIIEPCVDAADRAETTGLFSTERVKGRAFKNLSPEERIEVITDAVGKFEPAIKAMADQVPK